MRSMKTHKQTACRTMMNFQKALKSLQKSLKIRNVLGQKSNSAEGSRHSSATLQIRRQVMRNGEATLETRKNARCAANHSDLPKGDKGTRGKRATKSICGSESARDVRETNRKNDQG
ncbi:Hypothetical predicted protein [Cloeon dipterum]|uniref:Uncharacterized protein n=1 Tax=Cloeon dipterum TaxID=197152 RepID=A0A8S1D547_9INSE|nr:Hypothetical predicted protein [Cloeon dipterum]